MLHFLYQDASETHIRGAFWSDNYKEKRLAKENMTFHYTLKISPLNRKSGYTGYTAAKPKMCAFVCRYFQMCMTLYLLRLHHGNQLSQASAGSSVGCCIQKKQAAHSRSVSKTGIEIIGTHEPEILKSIFLKLWHASYLPGFNPLHRSSMYCFHSSCRGKKSSYLKSRP